MKNDRDRRTAILKQLADYILAEGLSAASLRPLAKAAGTSDRMLLYYFRDKADVMSGTLEVLFARLVTLLETGKTSAPLPVDDLRHALSKLVFAEDLWPYMRLWLDIASHSGRGDPLYRDIGERIGRGFLAWAAEQLDSTDQATRETEAARLLVSIEGMVLLKSIGLEDIGKRAL